MLIPPDVGFAPKKVPHYCINNIIQSIDSVKAGDGFLSLVLVRRLNENKIAGLAVELVLDDRSGRDFAAGRKGLAKIRLAQIPGKIFDVDVRSRIPLRYDQNKKPGKSAARSIIGRDNLE